jgi:hypothetical protein
MAEIRRGRMSEYEPEALPRPVRAWEDAEFPAGQTASERIKAILDWAGFGAPEQPAAVETCGFRVTDADGTPVFTCTEAPHPESPHVYGMLDEGIGE